MEGVMKLVTDRRNLLAGVVVLVVSVGMVTGTAFAHAIHHKLSRPSTTAGEPETCTIHSLGSFMDQGEFQSSSSVADVIEIECQAVYAEQRVTVSDNELFDRCERETSWASPPWFPKPPTEGPKTEEVVLDNDGNAIVVLWGGPSCAPGETLIAAHLDVAPFTTVATGFTVLPPRPTTPGVRTEPSEQVETEVGSEAATIVEVEFPPVFAEEKVNINASQLFDRCHGSPKLFWVGPNEEPLATTTGEPFGEEVTGVRLDNDGNAFVVLLAGSSCAAGSSLIEASLENAPYTTYTTTFTIKPPEPTFP
jgi:hypothetical protein